MDTFALFLKTHFLGIQSTIKCLKGVTYISHYIFLYRHLYIYTYLYVHNIHILIENNAVMIDKMPKEDVSYHMCIY